MLNKRQCQTSDLIPCLLPLPWSCLQLAGTGKWNLWPFLLFSQHCSQGQPSPHQRDYLCWALKKLWEMRLRYLHRSFESFIFHQWYLREQHYWATPALQQNGRIKGDKIPLSHFMVRGGSRTQLMLSIGKLRHSLETPRPCPSTDCGSCHRLLIRQCSRLPSKTTSAVPKPTAATLSSSATYPLTIAETGNSSPVMPNPIKVS